MRAFLLSTVCIGAFLVGCGDDTSTGAGGSGGSGTGASTPQGGGGQGTGGAAQGGGGAAQGGGAVGGSGTGGGSTVDLSECASDTDCPGGTCVEVHGGYRLCQVPVPEATMCGKNNLDECCTSADCAMGACYLGPLVPFCGGIIPPAYNQCGSDQCASDADCAGGACMPAGTVGNAIATCVPSACGPGCGAGEGCALVRDPCCNGPAGFFCVDPASGCQSNSDCPGGYCENGTCMAGGPICPA